MYLLFLGIHKGWKWQWKHTTGLLVSYFLLSRLPSSLKGGGGWRKKGACLTTPQKKIMPQFDDTGKNKKVIGIHLSQSGNITCNLFLSTFFMFIIPSQIFMGSEEVTLVFLPTVPLYLNFTITSTHIYLSPLLH